MAMIILPPDITEKIVGNAMSGILGLTIGQELEKRRNINIIKKTKLSNKKNISAKKKIDNP